MYLPITASAKFKGLATVLLFVAAGAAQARPNEEWFMVNAEGACIPMSMFDQIGPPTHTPFELYEAIRAQGNVPITIRKIPTDRGPAVLLEMGQERYPMLFTVKANCNGDQPVDLTRKPAARKSSVK